VPEQRYEAGKPITDGVLYRRIPNKADYYAEAEDRPSGLVFLPDKDEDYVSMSLQSKITPEKLLAGHPGYGLCEIDVRDLLEVGLRVTYQPEHGDDHVAVWGFSSSKPGARLRRKVAFRARVIRRPDIP
jgi:hypothetical protein